MGIHCQKNFVEVLVDFHGVQKRPGGIHHKFSVHMWRNSLQKCQLVRVSLGGHYLQFWNPATCWTYSFSRRSWVADASHCVFGLTLHGSWVKISKFQIHAQYPHRLPSAERITCVYLYKLSTYVTVWYRPSLLSTCFVKCLLHARDSLCPFGILRYANKDYNDAVLGIDECLGNAKLIFDINR